MSAIQSEILKLTSLQPNKDYKVKAVKKIDTPHGISHLLKFDDGTVVFANKCVNKFLLDNTTEEFTLRHKGNDAFNSFSGHLVSFAKIECVA